MLSAFKKTAMSLAAFAALLSADANAGGGWSVDFGNRSVRVSVSSGHRRYAPRRVTCPPRKVWVPGRYVTEYEKYWVPGTSRKVYVPPVHQKRYDACGNPYRYEVSPGRYEVVHEPGYWETRSVKVWKPGYWRVIHGRGR